MEKPKGIGCEIKELSHMIKRSIDEHIAQLEIEDITCVQAWIMGYVYQNESKGEIYQRDIEKVFHIRRSSVAETLRLMEKKELIIRESVSHDARLKKLILTPKARAIQEQIWGKIKEVEDQLVEGLSEGEMILFMELIHKSKRNIK